MSTSAEQRRLAAIMFTDMVGYTAMSQRNEALALELLEEHRRILRSIFPRFNGTEIKTIGDAFLVEFQSALEAAQCGLEIQRTLAKRNHDVSSDHRIELRIGIHVGDVVHREGDVYGDGVNIASRIQPVAGVGGICISVDVERQIHNALEARFEKLAPIELKNVQVPMDLFRIVLPWERDTRLTVEPKKGNGRPPRPIQIGWLAAAVLLLIVIAAWLLLGRYTARPPRHEASAARTEPATVLSAKSIAVLPLVNTSGDPANDYFSDGLSEELIAVLAKIPGLKIIGRSSSFLFKGKSDDSRTIGEKLGVANLLEGSVRKQGDRVRIVAELVNAADGRTLWSETYDRELKDVFAVQSEIAIAVTEQMKVKLLGQTARSDAAPSNQNLAAHNAVLQSDYYFQQQTAESIRQAIKFLQEAVRLDPNYALAFAKLSQAWRQYGASFSTDETAKAYQEAHVAAEKAASLAPDLVEVRKANGWISLTPGLDFRTAEKEFRRALELSPGDAGAKNALSYSLMAQGRMAEAEQACREAILLDPLQIVLWYNLGRLAMGSGRYPDAETMFRKGLEIQPHAARFHVYLAALELSENNPKAALEEAKLEPDPFWREFAMTLVAQTQPDRGTADAALRDFSTKYGTSGAFQVAVIYGLRKEPDQMFQWLDTAYTTRDSGLTQLVITPFFLPYRDDPRFVALCQKLGAQLPASLAKP